jgi:hypothetical protein
MLDFSRAAVDGSHLRAMKGGPPVCPRRTGAGLVSAWCLSAPGGAVLGRRDRAVGLLVGFRRADAGPPLAGLAGFGDDGREDGGL